jgi:C_GCAxxG_C_C family probable redox protein
MTHELDSNKIVPTGSNPPVLPALDSSLETNRKLQNRSLVNLSRMGHCAPSVMQTILDVSEKEAPWLVKLTAGLPGGIGNTGFECGGITAPLVLLGLRHGLGAEHEGLPLVFYKGHDLLQRFLQKNDTLMCKQIRGRGRLPTPCIGVIRNSPGLYAQTLSSDTFEVISGEQLEAFRQIYAHLNEQGFHCSHAVFQHLDSAIPSSPELLNATSAFIGGTVFSGMTCSAFTAGVMALGLRLAEIENSPLRVLHMIALMAVGGNAFADDVNKFNKIMNLGNELSIWFSGEFGSTQCQAITQCEFSKQAGVNHYIQSGCLSKCQAITQKVARKVQEILEETEANRGVPDMT